MSVSVRAAFQWWSGALVAAALAVGGCSFDDKVLGSDTATVVTDPDTDTDTDADTDTDTDADTATTATGDTGITTVTTYPDTGTDTAYPGAMARMADEGWRPLFWQFETQFNGNTGTNLP